MNNMTKNQKQLAQDRAATVALLASEGAVDITARAIEERRCQTLVNEGHPMSDAWVGEVEEQLPYIRGLVYSHHGLTTVAFNRKLQKRRSGKVFLHELDAKQYLCVGGGLTPAGLHIVSDAEHDFLWLAWTNLDGNRTTGKIAKFTNRINKEVVKGTLSEQTGRQLVSMPARKLKADNQALLNELAKSLTGPEQTNLALAPPKDSD